MICLSPFAHHHVVYAVQVGAVWSLALQTGSETLGNIPEKSTITGENRILEQWLRLQSGTYCK
jgi:hypothetical protein